MQGNSALPLSPMTLQQVLAKLVPKPNASKYQVDPVLYQIEATSHMKCCSWQIAHCCCPRAQHRIFPQAKIARIRIRISPSSPNSEQIISQTTEQNPLQPQLSTPSPSSPAHDSPPSPHLSPGSPRPPPALRSA